MKHDHGLVTSASNAPENPRSRAGLFSNMSIAKKFIFGFAALVLFSSCVSAFVIYEVSVAQQIAARKDEMANLSRTLEQSSNALSRQEATLVEHFLEPSDSVTADFRRQAELFDQRIARAAAATAEMPALNRRILEIQQRGASWRESFAEPHFAAGSAEPDHEELARAVADADEAMRAILKIVDEATVVSVAELEQLFAANKSSNRNATMATTFGAVGMLIVSIAIGFALIVTIARPVKRMTMAMNALAAGDSGVQIPERNRRDEIGAMAGALQIFKDNAAKVVALQEEQRVAEARTLEQAKHARLDLASNFERSVGSIVSAVSASAESIQTTARSLAETAERAAVEATSAAGSTQEASANVEMIASASEELSSSISEISEQVNQSVRTITNAVSEARSMDKQMAALASAAQEIGAVVSLISDIASQTNLLALNATIEAARAGDSGKGFAVVASEVKNLAMQTSQATDEITGRITGIQDAARTSVTAIQSIGNTVGKINEIASSIAAAVEEQTAATAEIARNAQQASGATSSMNVSVADVLEGAQQTGDAANLMLESAVSLTRQEADLRREVQSFLKAVKE